MTAPAPLGGRVLTRGVLLLLALGAISSAILAWRFLFGIGTVTSLSDGYPWGIWIAFDEGIGTAIACGGYALSLLVYVFNRGRYHPLVRAAMLSSALGYGIAGLSVFADIGRWWNVWRLAFFWTWNLGSVLLAVSLGITGYMMVAWIEVSRALLPRWHQSQKHPNLAEAARIVSAILEKVLPFVIALGLVLATVQQASLGSLYLVSTKLHPLWHTRLLPLLFLVSVVGMGCAGIVLETAISGFTWELQSEWKLVSRVAVAIPVAFTAYLAIRLAGLAAAGFPGFGWNRMSALLVVELLLFATPAAMLSRRRRRENPGFVFLAALLAVAAGGLYRIDTFLVAFDPGPGWHYFPSIPEMLVTLGFIAIEIAAYAVLVKPFPILRPRRSAENLMRSRA
jgi:Ni/Fe-hydrogenase subunit HybB-like protein